MESDLIGESLVARACSLFAELDGLEPDVRMGTINKLRLALRAHSPMRAEPVDCVLWVEADSVEANDYNPNAVAPPEMRLLEHSIRQDGFTQPIVAYAEDGKYTVIDGFHRNRVCRERPDIRKRLRGWLPIAIINTDREGRSDRIAATIRHNRARGKHQVDAMSDIVQELTRRNWSEKRIAKELGMDADEVLRLKQITGLAEMFADAEFTEAWEVSLGN